jgi:glycine oxidase
LRPVKIVDYIIIGQGLAGSCLALQLVLRNKRILVFDRPEDNHASAVAAGLFNPFTGRIMARTWLSDTLFPYLFSFYQEAEKLLDQKFFFPQPLYRPFLSVQEQNGWMGKSADLPFAPYIEEIFWGPKVANINDPHGGLLLKYSGYVDVPGFLKKVRAFLRASDSYREERLDEQQLLVHEDSVRYEEIIASGAIFCEGMGVTRNRFFSWLPINPLKGETIRIQAVPLHYIINRGVYIVPAGMPNEFTIGATYDFTSNSPGITTAGREDLEGKLKELLTIPYRVTGQNWGLRPTTLDQKVMIGYHPHWRNLLIFNGLGTKGVSQAPYFSGQLAGWLEGKNEIMREVNIQRYKTLYSKSE